MDILERCKQVCRTQPGTVVLPDCLDERALIAAVRLREEGLARPVLVQSPFAVRSALRKAALRTGLPVVDPASPEVLARNVVEFMALREEKGKPVERGAAEKAMGCPLAAAAMMVRRGEAEVGVAGNRSSTADVLRAGLSILPRMAGLKTISSFFLMISPEGERQYLFADCAVVPEPDETTLAEIAIASSEKARTLLGEDPRVAMLSFSTKGSAKHPKAEMVRAAVEHVRRRAPNVVVDGELQFDAASVPAVAALKAPGSELAGQANVFVFPSLEAGNIAYKMVQRLGGYSAMGPFLQGFRGGWHDLSRGCSAEDIVNVAVVAMCLERGSAAA